MGRLIGFEIKKIVSRRVTQIATLVILLMFAWVTTFNLTSQYALDPAQVGAELEGTAAIAEQKAVAEYLAGPITDQLATEKLREFQAFIGEDGEIESQYRTDGASFGDGAQAYWDFRVENGDLMMLITRPWMVGFEMPSNVAARIDTTETVDLYGQVAASANAKLADPDGDFVYSQEEQEFWMEKLGQVATPVEYGYAGGWADFLAMAQFLMFALLAVVIACASTFNIEYSERTDAVLLSTALGRSRLPLAKILAAVIVATIVYAAVLVVFLGVPLAFFGPDGAGLPLQVLNLSYAYSITIGEASLIMALAGYAMTLGMLGIVLAMSSKVKSSIGILAVGVALVLVPMVFPNLHSSLVNHIVYLLPSYALDPSTLFGFVSYALGPLVFEYPVVLIALYLALFVIGMLVAIRSFGKHQVA